MVDQAGTIGRGLRIKGEITGAGTLEVDGEVDGRVQLDQLVVHAAGVVRADVAVREAVIHGRTSGQITADKRLDVRATAQVDGDVHTASITVEEGAVFRGRIHMDTGIPEDI